MNNATHKKRKSEEARFAGGRQIRRMNYNNSSSRIVIPRATTLTAEAAPRKQGAKRARKSARRRLTPLAAVALFFVALGVAGLLPARAVEGEVSVVAAKQTVAFTGMTGRLSLDIPLEETVPENELMAQMDAFTAQVNAITAKSFQAVHPAQAARLSALTGVLLCAGVAVAIVRAGLLFRRDLVC